MMVGPDHPLFRERFEGQQGVGGGTWGGDGWLPQGAVPPGARFDPIGPAVRPSRPCFDVAHTNNRHRMDHPSLEELVSEDLEGDRVLVDLDQGGVDEAEALAAWEDAVEDALEATTLVTSSLRPYVPLLFPHDI